MKFVNIFFKFFYKFSLIFSLIVFLNFTFVVVANDKKSSSNNSINKNSLPICTLTESEKMGKENIKSLEQEKSEPREFTRYSDYLDWSYGRQLKMNGQTKRSISFKIFQAYEKKFGLSDEPKVLDDMTSQNLDILCGSVDYSVSLINKISRTKTDIGTVILGYMISHPLSNKQKLLNRQAIVKEFINNKELFLSLEKSFEELKALENLICSFWDDWDAFKGIALQKLVKLPKLIMPEEGYIKKTFDYINTNSVVLEVNERLDELSELMYFGIGLAGVSVLPVTGFLTLLNYQDRASILKDFVQKNLYVMSHIGVFSALGMGVWLLNYFSSNRAIKASNDVISGFQYGLRDFRLFDWLQANISFFSRVQSKLMAIQKSLMLLNKINEIVKKNPVLQNLELSKGIDYLELGKSENFDELKDLLDTDTFKGEPSFFSFTGRILKAFNLMGKQKDSIAHILVSIGEIDAYMSIARLYKEGFGKNNSWCFANYSDLDIHFQTEKYLNTQEFINKFEDDSQIKYQDYDLSGNSYQNYKNTRMYPKNEQDYDKQFVPANVQINYQNYNLIENFQNYNSTNNSNLECPQIEFVNPFIKIEQYWNPFLDPKIAISNSLEMGTYKNPKTVIITGPNAGGKSTAMKAVLISSILGQSIGIVPAKSFTFTPFAKIMTYLNIVDDIASGKSYFKAGVVRAHEILTTVKNLNKDEVALVALDEVFSGTSYKESQAAAYSLIKMLGQKYNNLCLAATHFPKITELEEKEPTNFRNYKVSVTLDQDKKIQYPFKLEKGISDQHIALQMAKEEGFSSDFLDDATEILNEN